MFNAAYIKSMMEAAEDSVLGKVKKLWWPAFLADLQACEHDDFSVFDRLDRYMNAARDELRRMAVEYAERKLDPHASEAVRARRRTLLQNQFLKSNTGKMFERFMGLAIAQGLIHFKLPYSILPVKGPSFKLLKAHGIKMADLSIRMNRHEGSTTTIDGDLMLFADADPRSFFSLLSVKSTLKDRFHNVPFWNLLRRCAVSEDFPEIEPVNREFLRSVHYIAVCTDLAEEQPDFGADTGPRNLLRLDASILDGAYVTGERLRGVPDQEVTFGPDRPHAFNKLSQLFTFLASRQ